MDFDTFIWDKTIDFSNLQWDEAVDFIDQLPMDDKIGTCRWVLDNNAVYIMMDDGWEKFSIVYDKFKKSESTSNCLHTNKRQSQTFMGEKFWYCPDCKKEI